MKTLLAGLALTALAAPVHALTLTETTEFSGNFAAPTEVDGTVYDTISGSWDWSTDFDFIAISGLTGGQELTVTFSAAGVGNSTGAVLWSESPLAFAYQADLRQDLKYGWNEAGEKSFSFTLSTDFNAGGDEALQIGLYNHSITYGQTLDYTISYDAGSSISAVPLPASALLLVGALGGLAALRRRKA